MKKADYSNNEIELIAAEVCDEVRRAKTLFPNDFVNQHEAYAVLLEEVDELWDEIKKNQRNYDLAAQRKEAIQAAAMLFRLIHELLPKPTND
jgi:NTP pyrophosphatase (non-canonical NTP hydrolase)